MPNRGIVQALGNFLLGSDKFQRSPDSAVGAPEPGDPADPWRNHAYGQRTNGHPPVGHHYANGQPGGFTFPHASSNSGPTWAAARAGTDSSDQQLGPATAHATSTASTTNAAPCATDAPRPAQIPPTFHGISAPPITSSAAPSDPLTLPSSPPRPSTTPIPPGTIPDPDQPGAGSGRQLEPTLSNASSCSSPAGQPMRAGRPSFSDATASAAGEALRQASMASSKAQFTRDNLVAYMRWVRASRGVMQLAGKGSCRNPHPQLLLRCEHWLEVTDDQHRYGSNLRVYFDYWVAEMEAAELTPPPSPALLSPSPSYQHLVALAQQQQQQQGTTGANPPLSTPGSAHAQFRRGESSGLAAGNGVGGLTGLNGRAPGSSPLGLPTSKSSADLTRFGQEQQQQQQRQHEKSSATAGNVAQVCAAAAAPMSIGGARSVECGNSPRKGPASWGPSGEGGLQGEVAHQEAEQQQKQQIQQQQQAQQQLECHAGPQHQRRHSCSVPSEGCGMEAEGQHGAGDGTGRAGTPSKGRASSDAALGHGQGHGRAGAGAGPVGLSSLGACFPSLSASRPQCFSPSMRFAQAMGVDSSDSTGHGPQRYQQVQGQDGAVPEPEHGGVLSPDAGRSPTSGLVCSELGNAGGASSVIGNGGDSSLGPWTASAVDGRSSAGLQRAPSQQQQQQAGQGAGTAFAASASAAAAAGALQGFAAQRAAKAMSHRNSVGNGSNFFRWLDHGPGMHVDLAGLGVPRAKLDAERVKYLTAEELLEYELDVEVETGLLRYKRSGKLLHTGHNDGRTSLDLGSDTRRPHTPPPPAVPLHADSSDAPWWAQLPTAAAACSTGSGLPEPGGTQVGCGVTREGGMGQGSSFRRAMRRTTLATLHEGQGHERQEPGDVLEPGMLGAGQRVQGVDGAAGGGVEGRVEEEGEEEAEVEGQEVGSMMDGDSEGGSSLPQGGSSSDDACGSGASPQSTGSTGRVADGGLLDVDGDGAANAQANGRKSCGGTNGFEGPALVREPSLQVSSSGCGGLCSPGTLSGGGGGMDVATAGGAATAAEEAPAVHHAGLAVDSAFYKAAELVAEELHLHGHREEEQQEEGHVEVEGQQQQRQQPHSPQAKLAAPQPVTPPAVQQLRQHSAPPLVVHQEKEKVAKWIYVVDPELRLFVHPKVRGRFHHSSFLCGGAVVAAGGLAARHGQLRLLTADSGHYWPREENFRWLCEHLVSVGADLSNCELRSKHMPVPAATGRELMERMGVPPPPPAAAMLRSSPWRGLQPHLSYPLLPATGSGGLGQGQGHVGVGVEQGQQGQGEGQHRQLMPLQVAVQLGLAAGAGAGAEPRRQISVLEDEEESVVFPGLSWCSIPDLKRVCGGER